MALLDLRSFSTLVQKQAAAAQAACAELVDYSVGSVLRAVAEAVAGVALWLQAQVVYVLSLTRASTSTGSDLDSWMGDYGLTRLGATPSAGQVTFSRFTASQQAVVPIGALVQTGDGSQRFEVVIDTTNPAYNVALGGYMIAAGISSLAVAVRAVTPTGASNVVAGAVSQLVTSIPFVDTCTNVAAMTGGADAESDAAYRARFLLYVASLSKATKLAVGSAIQNLQLGLQYQIVENYDYAGAYKPGSFYVVVDDGTGAPPSSLLDNVFAAVDLVRGAGITIAVFAPQVVNVTVAMSVDPAPGYNGATIDGLVGQAIRTYIDALPLGATLYYTRLAQVAYDCSPGVLKVSGVLLNGGTADVVATPKQVIKAPVLNVAIS